MTNGVGTMHVTTENNMTWMKLPILVARNRRTARPVTTIISLARLNWKRGSCSHGRVGWPGKGSDSGMISVELRTSFVGARSRIIPFREKPAKRRLICETLRVGLARTGNHYTLPSTSNEFLRGFGRFEFGDAMQEANLQLAIDDRQHTALRCRAHAFCQTICVGLRTARKHGDELAVFEFDKHIHFAKRFLESGHRRFDHLPGDRAAVLTIDDVEVLDFQIQ